jgi:DNA-binding IclR family transcriptional regulator
MKKVSPVRTKKRRAANGKAEAPKTVNAVSVPAPNDENPYFLRSVGKAFFILNFLSRSKRGSMLAEITNAADLTRSSCFRLLVTLQDLGYVTQDEGGRFAIAEDRWVNSGRQIAAALPAAASESVQRLVSVFRETVSLAVLLGNHIEVVFVHESPQVIRMANTVGHILPPHASSLGKAITAFQVPDLRNHLLRSYGLMRFTPATIIDESEVIADYETIRRSGIAREADESTPDGCCFGCPIFLGDSSAVAAISLSMPKMRLPEGEALAYLMETLRHESITISKKLREKVQ